MLTPDFYENYLNIFLNVFFKVCRDLKELQLVALECFHKYCEPVLDGTTAADDVTRLWRNISKTMKLALGTIYMRMENVNQELLRPITVDDQTSSESVEQMQTMKRLVQTLELPFYAKFLLIAAYLASHNAAKEDKRLFMNITASKRSASSRSTQRPRCRRRWPPSWDRRRSPSTGCWPFLRHSGREGRPDVQLVGANLNADSSQVPELCLQRGNHHGRQRATSVHRRNGLYRAHRQDGRLQRETIPVRFLLSSRLRVFVFIKLNLLLFSINIAVNPRCESFR
uniref:Origin recognition complex subunit 5 n=1 Tax=Culex pipiens TaxID=7175 RepID=A0A8D8AEZ3_CULPI